MKNKKKKWKVPEVSKLRLTNTYGGSSSHSEGHTDKWGNPKPGRVS